MIEQALPEVWSLRNRNAKAITTTGTKLEMMVLKKEYEDRYRDEYVVAQCKF